MGTKNRLKIALIGLAVAGLVLFIYRDVIFQPKPAFLGAVHRALPEISLRKDDGSEVSLQRILSERNAGKVIFSLWATWCEPCTHELPLIQQARERLAHDGTEVILVNYDGGLPEKTIPEVRAWLVSKNIKLPTYFDFQEQMLSAFKIEGLPFTVGVGKDRKVQWLKMGELDWTDKSLRVN